MRVPVVLMIILLALSVIMDLYIYIDIRQSCRRHYWKKIWLIASVCCWIFVVVALSLPRRAEGSGILPIIWMLYSYLTIYLPKMIYVLCSIIGRLWRLVFKTKSRVHIMRWIGGVLALFSFATMWWGVIYTRHKIHINRVDIISERVPASFNGYRIVQLSDLHVGTWGNDKKFISALVDSVNSLKPDLIVFTGDIVNRETSELVPFLDVLSRLHAPDGVYSILGNHDYGDYMDWSSAEARIENNRRLAAYQQTMGWTLLNNERKILTNNNDTIVLIGVENVGDPPFPTYGDLAKALPISKDSLFNQNDDHFKILLSHNPAHWEHVKQTTNIDLTLSGHTHAMQMMIKAGKKEWSPAVYRYAKWGGLYEFTPEGSKDALRLYVNIGAGEVGLPARLLDAYPEITLLTLLSH